MPQEFPVVFRPNATDAQKSAMQRLAESLAKSALWCPVCDYPNDLEADYCHQCSHEFEK